MKGTSSFAIAFLLAAPLCFAADASQVAGIEASWLTPQPRPNTTFAPDQLPARAAVLPVLEYVAASQIADMSRHPIQLSTGSNLAEISSNWVAATFYVGAARLARVSQSGNTLRFLTATAEHYNYALRGARSERTLLNADELAIGDLYQELHARRGQPGAIMPLQQRLDYMLPHLNRPQDTGALVWWWCDALFMAPPVLARHSALTGDPKYIRAMDREWRRTAARLWVEQDRLFLRDERFKEQAKPIYWARGNGWVMGGLTRTLETMPADFEGRAFYTGIFKKMASRIVELQQADGLWRSDLNDPASFPEAETSGSAFFVHALAWGINHGLLERQAYQPAVIKGWAALNRHVLPNGLIGAAQKTGDRPVPTAPGDVGPYATGAYLLAGLEVMDLNGPEQALPEPALVRDDDAAIAATTPAPIAPKTVVGEAEKARREQEMRATRALAYDPAAGKPKDWIDAKTGRRIIRVSDEDGSGTLYFYRHAYTPEGDVMVIKSPSGITAVRIKDWTSTLLIKGKENELLFMLRKTREAVYAVSDPGEGEDRPKTIYAIHIDTKTVRKLARVAAGRITGANADDTLLLGHVAFGAKPLQPKDSASIEKFGKAEYAALGPDGKPLNFAKAKGVRMLERWAARVPAQLFTINIRTGARKVLYRTEDWIGHAQFSPTDPKLIRFCMEGPWHRVDRIKLVKADGSGLRSAHTRSMNMEIWGHEFFSHDGKWLWYDLQTPRGQVFWIAGLELATGKRVWKRMEQNDWGVHFNIAPDNKTFASDGGDQDMVAHAPDGKWISLLEAEPIADADLASYDKKLVDIEKLKSTRLVDMSAHDYRLEPNLRFTPDGKWLVFASNMHGASHVYAVELQKSESSDQK